MKRLERGTFQRPQGTPSGAQVEMDATDLALLLSGIELTSVKRRRRYAFDAAKPTAWDKATRDGGQRGPGGKIFCGISPIWAKGPCAFRRSCYHQFHDRTPRIPQRSRCLSSAAASSSREPCGIRTTIASQSATITSQTEKIEELTTEMEKLRKLLSQFVNGHRSEKRILPAADQAWLPFDNERGIPGRSGGGGGPGRSDRADVHGDTHDDARRSGTNRCRQPPAAGRTGRRRQ